MTHMKLSELNTAALQALWLCANAEEIEVHHTLAHFSVDIEHRGLAYAVGRNGNWQGPYWVREDSTGIIFRGPLGHIKEMIKLCSAAHHEPHAIK
jgi:hypothetical protein